MPTEQIITRIRRAFMQDYSVYEEVRDDAGYTVYGVASAAIAVLLAAIGAWLWAETVAEHTPDGWFVDTVILGTLFTAVLFAIGIGVMYLVLTRLLNETVPSLDGFFRVAALAHVSYAAALLIFIPEIGFAFGLLAVAFVYFDTIMGVRAAYPAVSAWNAVVAVTAGVAVWAIVLPLISGSDNAYVTGPFVHESVASAISDNVGGLDYTPPGE